MKRGTIVLLAISHLAVAAIGLLVALRPSASGNESAKGGSSARPGAGAPGAAVGASGAKSIRPVGTWRGSEFRRAWKAVRTARLTTPERIATQKQLLTEWAKRDLAGALDAALEEAWDDELGDGYGRVWPLGEAFRAAFAEAPEQAWDLIESGRYGVGSGMLRHLWLEAAGERHPLLVASKLGGISWHFRGEALMACRQGFYSLPDETKRAELLNALAQHPDGVVSVEQLAGFIGPGLAVEDLNVPLDEADAAGFRILQAKARSWGGRMSLSHPDEFAAALDAVPEDLRRHAAAGAVDDLPFGDAGRTLPMLDLAAETGAWEAISDPDTIQRLQYLARQTDARSIAEWVTRLPPEPSLYQVIHRGVEPYFQRDMQGAREWIATIDEPMWRDRAYGEYSQQALNRRKDPAASRWALDRIQDPAFRATAEGWRRDWEKRTAPKGK